MSPLARLRDGAEGPTGRMLARLATVTERRPSPPSSFVVNSYNWFSWDAPDDDFHTHYRIRINHDDGEPDIEVPGGQTGIQLLYGTRFALTSYNQHNRLESYPVFLNYDANAAVFGGGTGSASRVETHTITGSSYNFTSAYTAAAGDRLFLKVYFNSSATAITFTWSSAFEHTPLDAVFDTTQTTYTYLDFVGVGTKWVFSGAFRTGVA